MTEILVPEKNKQNTLCEFGLVIAAVAKVSCKHGLWLVDCVNYKNYRADFICLSVIFIEKMLDPFEMCF